MSESAFPAMRRPHPASSVSRALGLMILWATFCLCGHAATVHVLRGGMHEPGSPEQIRMQFNNSGWGWSSIKTSRIAWLAGFMGLSLTTAVPMILRHTPSDANAN